VTRRPGRRRGPAKAPPPPHETILTIDHIGHRGDGVARTERGPVFVPNVLPGETVRASVAGDRATVVELVTAAPDRAQPFCPHFDACGGCTSQHMEAGAYTTWKRGIVQIALRNRGIDVQADPLIDAHGMGRRRATFHARFAAGGWVVGYSAQRSHHVVALESCPILTPELSMAPDLVRALAAGLAGAKRFDAQLTQTDTGLDVHITDASAPDMNGRQALADAAHRLDLARISVADETIAARRLPRVRMGPASVILPSGSFLQATAAGEQLLADLVRAHLVKGAAPKAGRRIADLFSGLGPFALRLCEDATVEAFDSDDAAISALNRAIHEAKLHTVKAFTRDLFGRPLHTSELDRFDGIVFDPPRAGAEAQARMLAASKVPLVVAVSCEPASFARDAALLIAGGYRLAQATPIDQFKWSPHVEIVGLFLKP
jgi:23S rRNA (uracil1939-C5)-methyltransferase